MELEVFLNIKEALKVYFKVSVLDFKGEILFVSVDFEKGVIIGFEGGFSELERGYFKECEIYCILLDMVLKFESVCVFVVSIV